MQQAADCADQRSGFYQPWKHPQRVLQRRNPGLKMMCDQNMLRLEQYSRFADVPLRLRDKQQPWRQITCVLRK